ncbi:hypothetical protein ABW19_dt0202005 [Dactylella cylindrospora]|nr:hypothetical protein ABW19_dt0202005 [Dactylella cylindrospora]
MEDHNTESLEVAKIDDEQQTWLIIQLTVTIKTQGIADLLLFIRRIGRKAEACHAIYNYGVLGSLPRTTSDHYVEYGISEGSDETRGSNSSCLVTCYNYHRFYFASNTIRQAEELAEGKSSFAFLDQLGICVNFWVPHEGTDLLPIDLPKILADVSNTRLIPVAILNIEFPIK